MTTIEINVAIAEARGWTNLQVGDLHGDGPEVLCGHPPGKIDYDEPPDHCHDLNAMHEAKQRSPTSNAQCSTGSFD